MAEVLFNVSQKFVRDHFRTLLEKYKAKIRNEKGALGLECEEIELHKLL